MFCHFSVQFHVLIRKKLSEIYIFRAELLWNLINNPILQLIPSRVDWTGQEHSQSYDEYVSIILITDSSQLGTVLLFSICFRVKHVIYEVKALL